MLYHKLKNDLARFRNFGEAISENSATQHAWVLVLDTIDQIIFVMKTEYLRAFAERFGETWPKAIR